MPYTFLLIDAKFKGAESPKKAQNKISKKYKNSKNPCAALISLKGHKVF